MEMDPIFWILFLLAGLVVSVSVLPEHSGSRSVAAFDYIVIGCGVAGLVVATRLSELQDVTVLCIEAGALDHDEEAIFNPYYIGLQPPGFYEWQINSVPQTHLDGLPRHVAMGKGVGGGSLINGMVWNRGNQESFDSWAALGNDGWAWADLLPYFRKSETFTPHTYPTQDIAPTTLNTSVHGVIGPVQVSFPNYYWNQSNNWFDALQSAGIPISMDPDEGLTAGGYFLPLSMDPNNETRSDARTAYYDPARSRPNLQVLPNHLVTRIIFDNNASASGNVSATLCAVGIEIQDVDGRQMVLYASREVILAAGAIHTPQILELSGIGQANILQELSIQVLQDLPGVGNNFQDHALIHLNYTYTNPDILTINDFQTNRTFNQQCASQYYTNRTGPWTAKPSSAVAFPSLRQFSNNTQTLLGFAATDTTDYLPANYETTLREGYTQQFHAILDDLDNTNTPCFEILNNNAGGLDLALMRPLSRGTVHITTADPFTAPAINPRWLIHPLDLEIMIQATQFNQFLLSQPSLAILQPTYPDIPQNATRTQIAALLSQRVTTEYHYAGTAAMLPLHLGGVVDNKLLVYGTQNLRVVDTSVFPIVPGAHLQAVAYAVAEKAADVIKGVDGIGPT